MKMKARHIVPLSRQAIEVFRELHAKTGADYLDELARESAPVSTQQVYMSEGV